ncbi:histone H2A.Z-specific chaperone CHZ1 [Aspergillus brunneoviolaceus CBS 621.78]|uniref:Uncharacterized protein n=1 Tax=Aspergillus brunneoviolaceus CBS 621.78 TaxID=1450534 RepID=A0ACD1G4R0_9EURO|nr:hypothetical protein BO95DRAFT_433242 [Aspergillus brunneoviolaceus CBS 621.78]RAH44235.1 hypothetical protein BO95DRAFT_433242 [Aspergillus brunneoviolaceus CBS 621.78]
MGDSNQATTPGYDRAANAPDAAALDKGKGRATEPTHDENLEEEDSDESENEEMAEDGMICNELQHYNQCQANPLTFSADNDDDGDNLEPISEDNIISGGRRTRGKIVDYQAAAEKLKADNMMDDDEEDDDEDYEGGEDDEDTVMRG